MPYRAPTSKMSGQRRHYVALQSSGTTKDTIGGQQDGDYQEFGHTWANIQDIPFIVSGSEHGVLYDITIPYRADLIDEFKTSRKRVQVVASDRTYNLLEIEDPEHRRHQLVLHCAPA